MGEITGPDGKRPVFPVPPSGAVPQTVPALSGRRSPVPLLMENQPSRSAPLFGERGSVVLKLNAGNYYVGRRWRVGHRNLSETLARFGHHRPRFFAPTLLTGDCRQVLPQIPSESVHLIVTSPPYLHLKETPWVDPFDNSTPRDRQYVRFLNGAWPECFRVLDNGCRLAVNIGDTFTSVEEFGANVLVAPIVDIIQGTKAVGFLHRSTIIWAKGATHRPSGGGRMMGSWPHPRGPLVANDFEYILIFQKPGTPKRTPSPEERRASKLRKKDLGPYVNGIWTFPGERKSLHPAPFPPELPYRLIRMFSFVGDTVLDPFSGSGTTVWVATQLARRGVGIEFYDDRTEVARNRLDALRRLWDPNGPVGKKGGKRTLPPGPTADRPWGALMTGSAGAALYLRVSTEDQDLKGQERDLRAFVASQGWNVVAVYTEKVSGTGKVEREEYDRLLRDAARPDRGWDTILVWSLDRFSREERFDRAVGAVLDMEKCGVRFASLKEPYLSTPAASDATSTFARNLLLGVITSVAAFESRRKSERVRVAMREIKEGRRRTRSGLPPGRPRRVTPEKAAKVLELRRLGLKWKEVATRVGLPAGTCASVWSKAPKTPATGPAAVP